MIKVTESNKPNGKVLCILSNDMPDGEYAPHHLAYHYS